MTQTAKAVLSGARKAPETFKGQSFKPLALTTRPQRKRTSQRDSKQPDQLDLAASGTAVADPPTKPSWRDVVKGNATPEQVLFAAVERMQLLERQISDAKSETTAESCTCQQGNKHPPDASFPVLQQQEHLLKHSKQNRIIVFGVPESVAYSTPAAVTTFTPDCFRGTSPWPLWSEHASVWGSASLGRRSADLSCGVVV